MSTFNGNLAYFLVECGAENMNYFLLACMTAIAVKFVYSLWT